MEESTLKLLIVTMRPKQWTKNFVVFAALIFSQNLLNGSMALISLGAFAVFCLLSSAIYLFNDLMDMEEDRVHPRKAKRPLASGRLKPGAAWTACVVVSAVALGSSLLINLKFAAVAGAYYAIQLAYCLVFKRVVIMDVFSIASGFFLRVVAGAHALLVFVSPWLMICTFFLSLFLSLCKRRHEIILLEGVDAASHRDVLKEYNVALLDQMITVVTSATVLTYTIYTIAEETVKKFHTVNLLYTIPFVLYGVYRYLYLVYHRDEGGSPELVFIADKPMILNIVLYGVTVVFILYFLRG